jgi:hypothetical protein
METVDIEKARQFLRDKEERRRILLLERLARAREDFDRIVAMIAREYHPVRIDRLFPGRCAAGEDRA